MNIQQLRYFCAVMRTGSFSAAARAEDVTVQAVSKAIAELESELGGPIFVRRSRGVVPTAFGIELNQYAEQALVAFDQVGKVLEARRDAAGAAHDDVFRILLAVPYFNNYRIVCAGLERFLSKQLAMKVDFGLCMGYEAVPQLLSGDLDALITVGEYANPLCDCVRVGSLPVGVFVANKHPLRKKKLITIEDLAPYPVGHAEGLDDFNETILNLYLKNGMTSRVVNVRTQDEVKHLLRDEFGFTMGVGISAFAMSPSWSMLRFVPKDSIPISVCAVSAKDHKSERYLKFEHFMLKDFANVMKLLGS
ncbi:LysR family transcriptional regulator [Collinsella sp. An2]|uniref:LysR family transcriptional regulator n=1 Tax=Collinsella sp. An2 TaxID=1965585 RepID=UPI000B377010|nr:LysR family transcriptional regulator [Collinsella sp. An2]OUP05932.1 hypothetical protein B5F33_10620 [Collinsella sp. An2]